MRLRGALAASIGVIGVVIGVVACLSAPFASATTHEPVMITGVGAAHGFGMAMDGVEGQARAGWSADRILDLFYPGSTTGRATGKIRIGLADGNTTALTLPSGGFVSDAPRGIAATDGLPVALPPGTRLSLVAKDTGVVITGGLPVRAQPVLASAERPAAEPDQEPALLPPLMTPTPSPAPRGTADDEDPATTPSVNRLHSAIFVWGAGDPALVGLSQTGHRYRGTIEVKRHPAQPGLVVVNHVDLETYVRGIAEEKGQDWPAAGLQVLAVAARSLGAATTGWYDKNQANGFDICPSANCQVYLGYDGEEPAMTAAVAATAGDIRTYDGRPIMAMYHGNGGGQTESYKRAIGGGSDPHPYLASVRYPFAAPSRWELKTTLADIDMALRDAGVSISGTLNSIGIVERGESPRVLRLRIDGSGGATEVSGTRFADALDLRSTWFEVARPDAALVSTFDRSAPNELQGFGGLATTVTRRGTAPAIAVALAATGLLVVAVRIRRRLT